MHQTKTQIKTKMQTMQTTVQTKMRTRMHQTKIAVTQQTIIMDTRKQIGKRPLEVSSFS